MGFTAFPALRLFELESWATDYQSTWRNIPEGFNLHYEHGSENLKFRRKILFLHSTKLTGKHDKQQRQRQQHV